MRKTYAVVVLCGCGLLTLSGCNSGVAQQNSGMHQMVAGTKLNLNVKPDLKFPICPA